MKRKKLYLFLTIIGILLITTSITKQYSNKKWLNTIETLQEADKIEVTYTSSNTSNIYMGNNLSSLKQNINSITEINKFNKFISQNITNPYCELSFYQNGKSIGTVIIWELSESIRKDGIELTSIVNSVPCVVEIENRFCQFNKDNIEIKQ